MSPCQGASKRTYQIAVAKQVKSLDPLEYASIVENYLGNNIVETLIARDPKTGHFVPRAAKAFSVSTDGLKITFYLRPDLRWSNGNKIKASDFEYSIKRILDPVNRSPNREKLMAISGAEEFSIGGMLPSSQIGVKAEGESTLHIHLRRPSASILNAFSQPWMGAVSKDAVDRYLQKWTEPQSWIGSGVFIPALVTPSMIVLKKNKFHRFHNILRIDEVMIHLVQSREEGMKMYLSGNAHVFGHRDFDVPENARTRFTSRSDLVAQSDFLCTILRLNTTKVPFSNEKLRQALAMAIDRELIVSGLGSKGERTTYSVIPEEIQSYDPPSSYLYSATRAKKLLASLGYCTKENATGCSELPFIEITFLPGEKYQKLALTLSVMIKKNLGWKNISIKERAHSEFVKDVGAADYTLAIDDIAVLPEHPFGFLDAFRKERSTSGGFVHREFERMIDAAELSTDWGEAKSLYRRAEGILMQDGGVVPLFHGATYIMVSPIVRGFEPNIWDDHPFSQISFSKE